MPREGALVYFCLQSKCRKEAAVCRINAEKNAGFSLESPMKLKFKVQHYQTHAVDSLADCFAG